MNNKIKFLRESFGLTEKEVATFLNISVYKYIYFEKSGNEIPLELLIMISIMYGIEFETLISKNFDIRKIQSYSANILKSTNNNTILSFLNYNLTCNKNQKPTYKNIRKIKTNIQENIIHTLLVYQDKLSLNKVDFSIFLDIDVSILNSILNKKRFINIAELRKISNKLSLPISSILFLKRDEITDW